MKYCPYCGADLADGTASFCMECGKSIPTAGKGQKKENEKRVRAQNHKEKNKDPSPRKSQRKHKKVTVERVEQSFSPKDDGYDGYYDDVLPSDAGKLKEGVDMVLVKKISAVAGVMLLIIILCLVAMYLL